MSPKEKPAPAWRREQGGAYRSADDRFEIDAEGSGRWFVRDEEVRDELGQPRMRGPYATLADAKAAAEEARERQPELSPLAARLAAAKKRPSRRARPGAGTASADAGARAAAAKTPASKEPAAKARDSWLDALERTDREAGRRARSLVRALEHIGVTDAEAVVRRDLEGRRPAVAEAVLAVALRQGVAEALDPESLLPAARRAIPGLAADDEALAAFAMRTAARVIEALLRELSEHGRLERGGAGLPGWRLVEDREGERSLIVTAGDVLGRGD
jgi:hypothetical protein